MFRKLRDVGSYRHWIAGADYSGIHYFNVYHHGTAKVKIRSYENSDWPAVAKLYERSGLPSNCLADATSPLFLIRRVCIDGNGQIAMAAFVKLTSEPFLLVDHDSEDASTRWEMLQALTRDVCRIAKERGLEQLTCWVPPNVEGSFGKRLEQLGFQRSPWQSYTMNL